MSKWLTDKEKSLLFAALAREKKVCAEVDKESCMKNCGESLVSVIESLENKFYYDRLFKQMEKQIQADALDIDMDKPMHFTDEQKAWIKNYIIINAKRQRADTIDECIKVVEWGGYTLDIKRRIEQLKDRTLAFTNNSGDFHLEPVKNSKVGDR